MGFSELLQLLGGVILSAGYIPQIIRITKTRSAKDFHFLSFVMMFCGIAMMEVYAVTLAVGGTGQMYLVTNTVSLILVGIMCVLIIKYGSGK